MKQRFLSALLVLCMIFMLVPGAAAANMEPTSGSCGENVNWSYDEATKTLTISGTGDMDHSGWGYVYWREGTETVVVESGVTSICVGAFYKCPILTKIDIADTVTTISENAFLNCQSLTEVTLPDGVTTIGRRAFGECPNLTRVILPDSVKNVDDNAFQSSTNISHVVIPAGVKKIGRLFRDCPLYTAGPAEDGNDYDIEFKWTNAIPEEAFWGYPIREVILPKGLKSIGEMAFSSTGLKTIEIPKSVIRINEAAFADCENLTSITVDEENSIYSSYDGMLLNKEKTELICCPSGKTFCDIPASVRTIGNSAFSGCKKISNITLPEKLETIGLYAFESCEGLTTMVIPDSVDGLGSRMFNGCKALRNVTLPGGVRRYSGMFFDKDSDVQSIKIGEGTEIVAGMFSNLGKLTTVSLPASLRRINENTFANCHNLSTVYFAGTQAQFDGLEIDQGNQELRQAEIICLGGGEPEIPDTPDTPEPEAPEPGELPLRVSDGGMGRRVTVTVEGGHWLTIQIRRAGSLAITSVQAPGSGLVAVSFSAPAGSMLQLWETEEEMSFQGGVPGNVVLSAAAEQL